VGPQIENEALTMYFVSACMKFYFTTFIVPLTLPLMIYTEPGKDACF